MLKLYLLQYLQLIKLLNNNFNYFMKITWLLITFPFVIAITFMYTVSLNVMLNNYHVPL